MGVPTSQKRQMQVLLSLVLIGCVLAVPVSLAQSGDDDVRPNLLGVSDSVENDYIRAYVGYPVVDDDADLGIHPLMQSKIFIQNVGGEPLALGDDGARVTDAGYIGIDDTWIVGIDQYATIAVRSTTGDSGDAGGGTGGGGTGGTGGAGGASARQDEGYLYYVFGEDDYGTPVGGGTTVIDGVTHISREFFIDDESLLVTQYLAPYRGLVRLRWVVENLGDEPKQVALRFRHHPSPLEPAGGIGGFRLYQQGVAFPEGYSPIKKEIAFDVDVLGQGALPTGWVSYSEDGSRAVGYVEVNDSSPIGSNPKLERMEFTAMNLSGEGRLLWEGTVNDEQIANRSSVMPVHYFFEPVSIEPGDTDAFQFFIGNRWASESVEGPLHASSAARPAVRMAKDPDTGEYGFSLDADGTFPVGGYVTNRDVDVAGLEAGQLRNAAVTVVLPEGLLLEDGSSTGTKTIGGLGPGETAGVSWKVKPDPSNPKYGNLTWTMQFTGEIAGGVHSRTVKRSIAIPALGHNLTPIITPPGTPDARPGGQYAMFGVPYDVPDPDPMYGLTYTSVDSGAAITPTGVYRFDPQAGAWDTYPNGTAGELAPGRSYFVRVTERARIEVPSGASFLNNEDEITVPLVGRFDSPVTFGGFNMIGNPFTYPSQLGELNFLYNGRVRTYRDAWESGWLPGVVWQWDPDANEGRGGYILGYGEDFSLNPWEGYWLLANVNMEMIMEPPASRGAPPPIGTLSTRSVSGNGTEAALDKAETNNSLGDWMLQLRAQSETAADSSNFIGVAPESASRDMSRMSIPEPPVMGSYVQLAFTGSASGNPAELLAHDVRSASAEQGFEMVVSTNLGNEDITVDWPTIHQLPRELSLVLEDTQTGERVFMRTEGAYSFTSAADGESRTFNITVSARDRGLQIASLTTESLARGGASIVYTLSADAEVDLMVMNAAGRVVRTVQSGEVAVSGRNLATWDGRSDLGSAVPHGVYTVKLTARSTDGGRVSQVASLSVN